MKFNMLFKSKNKTQAYQLRKDWIAALRSGDYRQGICWLKDQNTYCCLGVLCDISGLGVWRDFTDNSPDSSYETENESDFGCLPSKIAKLAGIDTNHIVFYKGKPCTLTELNDQARLNFNQIADLLEDQLLNL